MAVTLRVFVLPTTRRKAHLPSWMLPGVAHDATVCHSRGLYHDEDFGGQKPLCLNCLRSLYGRLGEWMARCVGTAQAEFSDHLAALGRRLAEGKEPFDG
jgi:hypothetical protein